MFRGPLFDPTPSAPAVVGLALHRSQVVGTQDDSRATKAWLLMQSKRDAQHSRQCPGDLLHR